MVKSRFNWHFYINYAFVFVFLALSMYAAFGPELKTKSNPGSPYNVFVALLFLALAIFLLRMMLSVTRWITVYDEYLQLNTVLRKRTITKDDIKEINLFSRESFYWTAGAMTVATKIELRNGEQFVIADPFYSNTSAIKHALVKNSASSIRPFSAKPRPIASRGNFVRPIEKYSGNPYTSGNAIIMYVLILIFAILSWNNGFARSYSVFVPLILLFYFAFGSQMHYFIMKDGLFIVKNHLWFWRHKEYLIKDIIQANIEILHKRSDGLRITTADFTSKVYSAGTLRRKDWMALKEMLESEGVYFG